MTYIGVSMLLKPFVFLALMVLVVLPIEFALKRVFPESRLKDILFDRNIREKNPDLYSWVVVILLIVVGTAVYLWVA